MFVICMHVSSVYVVEWIYLYPQYKINMLGKLFPYFFLYVLLHSMYINSNLPLVDSPITLKILYVETDKIHIEKMNIFWQR